MEWITSTEPVSYEKAMAFMEDRVAHIRAGSAGECIWLLQHPPLYTAGTSARPEDLKGPRFPVYPTGRGGQYTYHGPGQRIAYVMLDLKKRFDNPDIKAYIAALEEWIIRTLFEFDIQGERRQGRVGIWVPPAPTTDTKLWHKSGFAKGPPSHEKKIAAIGVRIRHWVTFHGISLNIAPDLSHYQGIVPCGISDYGVTSMQEVLGSPPSQGLVDQALARQWDKVFETMQNPLYPHSAAS